MGVGAPWPLLHACIHTHISHSSENIIVEDERGRNGMLTPERHRKDSREEGGRGGRHKGGEWDAKPVGFLALKRALP